MMPLKRQVLVCVCGFPVNQYFDGSVLPPGDKGVQKRDLAIFLLFVCEFDAVCFVYSIVII